MKVTLPNVLIHVSRFDFSLTPTVFPCNRITKLTTIGRRYSLRDCCSVHK